MKELNHYLYQGSRFAAILANEVFNIIILQYVQVQKSETAYQAN